MENNNAGQETISIFLESNKYSVIEASKLDIPVVLVNLGETGDYFELSVIGVPHGWVSLPSSPVIFLERGESKRIYVRVSPPPSVASIAGEYLLLLRVASQNRPDAHQQKQITLDVANSEEEGKLALLFESTEFSAAPGARVEIPFVLHNQSDSDGFFDIGVAGIPPSWIENPPSVAQVAAGARKNITLILDLPPASQVKAGPNNFTVFARNQANPSQSVEAGLNLVVAAFRVAGRIGLLMGAIQFSCSPGKSVEVPITLLNQGLEEDTLSVSVDGIPRSWVSMPSSSMRLRPGEQRDLTITIRPPRAPESRAGRHVFKVKVASALAKNTPVEGECVLSMATFADFNIEFEKHQLQAGENARLVVKNQGNVQQAFLLSWSSPEDSLVPYVYMPLTRGAKTEWKFLQMDQAKLTIPAGQEGATTFRLKPRVIPILGNPEFVPFKAEIVSTDKRKLDANGQVVVHPFIPIWLAGVFGILVVAMLLMLAVFALSQIDFNLDFTPPPTQTSDFAQTVIAMQTQTAVSNANATLIAAAGMTQTAQVINLFATNTPTPGTPTIAAFTPTWTPTSTTTFTPTVTSTITATPTIPVTPSQTPTNIPIFRGEMLVSSNRENGVNQIYSFTGSTGQTVGRLTYSTASDERPAWSPDGKKVAFSTNRDGNWEIYVMDANGSNLRNLTSNAAADQYPTWSPDGQSIAFTSNRDGNLEVYKVNADGTGLLNLTNSTSDDQMPDWGTVGGLFDKRVVIAFVSNRNGNDEIYLITPDGLNLVNITNNPARDYAPAISPDGSIAFVSNRSSNEDIFVMAADGSNINNLTNHPAQDTFPTFSGDGTELAFATNRDGNWEIYIASKDGKLTYNLTKNFANDQYPAWR